MVFRRGGHSTTAVIKVSHVTYLSRDCDDLLHGHHEGLYIQSVTDRLRLRKSNLSPLVIEVLEIYVT